MPGTRLASGDRITLRTVEREDAPFVQRAFTDPEVRRPMGNPVRNLEQIDVPSEGRDTDQFLVCLDDDGGPGQVDPDDVRPIGQVNVSDMQYKRPELGYWLVPEVHGEGYGTEAVGLVIDYVFREYDTPAVGAIAYDFNDASRGLLESLGFTREGRCRKFMFVDGEHRDVIQYGLLREEWREQERL